MRPYLLSAIIGLCTTFGLAQTTAPLAGRLPADTLFYAGWAGRSLILDGSVTGQLLMQETLGELLASAKQAALGHLDDSLHQEMLNSFWAMGAIAWQHPAAVGLANLRVDSGRVEPGLILLVELGTDRDTFGKQLDELLQAVGKEREIREETIGKVSYRTLPGPAGKPLAVGFIGELFFATLGDGLAKRVIELPETDSLQANILFQKALSEIADGEPQAAWYLDIPSLISHLDNSGLGPGSSDGQAGAGRLRRLAAAIGLENATHLAGTATIIDRGILVRTRLSSPAPHRRMLTVFSGEALTDEDLAGIGEDACHVLAIKKPPAVIYDQLMEALQEINPSAAERVQAALTQLERETQLDLHKELLGALGETWTISCAPSWGGCLTGSLAAFSVNDSAKLSTALEKIDSALQELSDAPDAPLKLLATRTGQADIRYLRLRRSPIAPAWALHEETLYVAAWPQVIVSGIETAQQPGLACSAEFTRIRSRLSPKPCVLEYLNLASIVRHSYPLLLMAWTAATSGDWGDSVGPLSRPDRLPALATLERYIWPSVAVVSSDPAGITFESYGSLPLSGPAGSPGAVLGGMGWLLSFALRPGESAAPGPADAPAAQAALTTQPQAPETAQAQPVTTRPGGIEPPTQPAASSQPATRPQE